MKTVFSAILVVLCLNAFAQNKSKCDMPCKKNKFKRVKKHIGLDLGINAWRDYTSYPGFSLPPSLDNPQYPGVTKGEFKLKQANSWNVNLWPLLYEVKLTKKTFSFKTGLGFQIYNYKFDSDLIIFSKGAQITMPPTTILMGVNALEPYKKNKLGLTYLSTPLIFRFTPKIGKQRYQFGTGAMLGYQIKSWVKQVDISSNKVKYDRLANMEKWQYSAVGELGIKDKLVLYGSYALNNMYKQDIDFRPFTVGIRLID